MGVINGPAHNYSRPIGYYQGLWNEGQWPNKTKWNNVKNGPWINMEIFTVSNFEIVIMTLRVGDFRNLMNFNFKSPLTSFRKCYAPI